MTTMPFGKYRGQLIEELPTDYLEWLHFEADIYNEALAEAIEEELLARPLSERRRKKAVRRQRLPKQKGNHKMRKPDELEDPGSSWNKACENEMLFILLGRDKAAPATIRYWCAERIRLGKNKPEDGQIREALGCASAMEMGQL